MGSLDITIEKCVALVYINRQQSLNALNRSILHELKAFLEKAQRDEVLAIVLTGSGDKSFISGADIKELEAMDARSVLDFIDLGKSVTLLLQSVPIPTIAAVNGYALGGGLEMALACDFIFAASNVKMGLVEANLGVIPGFGGTQRLAQRVGQSLAKELMMTAEVFSSDYAFEVGLVNRLFDKESLLEETLNTAKKIASMPRCAIRSIKEAVNEGQLHGIDEGMNKETLLFLQCFETPEKQKLMRKFMTKGAK